MRREWLDELTLQTSGVRVHDRNLEGIAWMLANIGKSLRAFDDAITRTTEPADVFRAAVGAVGQPTTVAAQPPSDDGGGYGR